MEFNDNNIGTIIEYLNKTLSSDPAIRRPAEKFLEIIEIQENFPMLLLQIVNKEDLHLMIRTSGVIAFKNYIKRNWNTYLEDYGPNRIHENDRNQIKQFIVTLMLTSPLPIQRQLSEAISIIGKYDFPEKWPQLINEMVTKFASGDFYVINGVLRTAHSIFKHYRFDFKSQKLWQEIKFVLDNFADPFTKLLTATMELVKTHEHNEQAIEIIYSSLTLMCKVFYSLNAQDLPEYFEDNMKIWMTSYHELLTKDIACLVAKENDDDGGVLVQLRSEICNVLRMYAQKYDEEFYPYMKQFVTDVWELLVKTDNKTKYDNLVSNAIQFLAGVAERTQYREIFDDPAVLISISEKVIIPNLDFRASDEELFEYNPEEYIRRDIEGSEFDTRRHAAETLMKALTSKYEEKMVEIFGQYLQVLLTNYNANPEQNWKAKNAAIFIVSSMTKRGYTIKHGVTITSKMVPLLEFCEQHVINELERQNVNDFLVLRADALKFMMSYRSILGPVIMLKFMPQFIRHLQSTNIVVHSYAASTIEKVLTLRDNQDKPLLTQTDFSPLVGDLLNGLFTVLTYPESTENEYIMKTILKTFSTLQDYTMPYMAIAMPRLTELLTRIVKNPSQPDFNHALFETLAETIKIVCKRDANAVLSFELVLFPIFQEILQQDITDFFPYVFQMLSLLLELREYCPIGDVYWEFFTCILTPSLWDQSVLIPSLSRLVVAYIRKGSKEIQARSKLNPILGIYQKLVSSKMQDHEGFYLLHALCNDYPFDELQQYIKQIFAILFQRLSTSKTVKFVRSIYVFFCFYAQKFGVKSFMEIVDNIQTDMFRMVIERLLLNDMLKITSDLDRKIVTVGLAAILCGQPCLLETVYNKYWEMLLDKLFKLFEMKPNDSTNAPIESQFGLAPKTSYTELKEFDPFPEITNERQYFALCISKLSSRFPNKEISERITKHTDIETQKSLILLCSENNYIIE